MSCSMWSLSASINELILDFAQVLAAAAVRIGWSKIGRRA